eukprot:5136023-Amphidinium_carterae.1
MLNKRSKPRAFVAQVLNMPLHCAYNARRPSCDSRIFSSFTDSLVAPSSVSGSPKILLGIRAGGLRVHAA